MVRCIVIIVLSFYLSTALSQRINLGFNIGAFPAASNKTLFDNSLEYFLYAAPYSENQDYVSNFYNQIRLLKINGIATEQDNFFKENSAGNGLLYGVNINYLSKNNFGLKFSINNYRTADILYYTNQNLMINTDEDDGFYIDDYFYQYDGKIEISKYVSSLSLLLNYTLSNKFRLKPFVALGLTERIVLLSSYTSELQSYLQSNNPLALNNKKLQDDLFREFSNDNFKHYANIGLGFRLHSFELSLVWNKTMFVESEYFLSQQFYSLIISYDIMSIPLFK